MLNKIIRNVNFSLCLGLNPPVIDGVNEAGESFGIEGETVRLSCSNEPIGNMFEEFRWFDSEGGLIGSSSIVRPHVLVLDNVTRNQSGVYTCVVSLAGESL